MMSPDLTRFGRILVVGLVITGVGGLLYVFGKVPGLGRLPGDVYYEGDGFSFYFPLTTSILLSLLFSLLIYLFRFFLR